MKCCENCFQDPILLNIINSFDEQGDCDYCDSEDVYVVAIDDLADLFDVLYRLYSETQPYEHFHPELDSDYPHGDPLINLINEEWTIFSELIEGTGKDEKLLFDILKSNKSIYDYDSNYPDNLASYSRSKDNLYYEDPLHYLQNDWDAFSNEIKKENRFFNKNADRIFVGIERILKKKEKTIELSVPFFRGRIGKFGTDEMYGPP
ncbi:MAG: HEPN-associated N-terminal domain-containing protein, partial [Sporosarcina sp.]